MPREPSSDAEFLRAQADTMNFAFRTLVRCLEDRRLLEPGQFADALRIDMELRHEDESDLTLALLHELRVALIE